MVEARRSVWDLRCHLLESGDLVSAMRQIVEPLAPSGRSRVVVEIVGKPVRLATAIEMNLLRIGQEAVSNAVKHGHARQISIELNYSPQSVRLSIRDDGTGFVADQPVATGHFGLLDMRERAQSMGASLQIESRPEQGTRITLDVSLKPNQLAHEEQPEANTHTGGG
jgi:signal transduction histidine kinase